MVAVVGCARATEPPPTPVETAQPPPAAIELAPAAPLAPPPATPATALEGDLELLRVADPWHPLPEGYTPADLVTLPASSVPPGYGGFELRREAAEALTRLLDAGRAAGHDLRAISAYRSFASQAVIFERRTAAVGEERAARGSARPGHSEHQLGTTVDLTSAELDWRLSQRLGDTEAGRWLAAHGHEHGWVLSYPAGKEDVTGYMYEPWHARYLGHAHATAWRQSGLTVTEYLQSIGGPR